MMLGTYFTMAHKHEKIKMTGPVETILGRMEITEKSNVYWIGRKATRLTFLSQQQRALNLIWALVTSGTLRENSRVAIVGAGLAGLTAAFAAHRLDIKVTVIERKALPLHMQRGCQLRYIHPHILDWPEPQSTSLLTNLPCMNWGAGMASSISETVFREWGIVSGSIDARYNFDVRSVGAASDGRPVVFAEGNGQNLVETFDVVILAVGFGLERTIAKLPFLSYWENDNFGRPILTGSTPRHYLITGCGDGGLIDAIRLRINAFDHAIFVFGLNSLPNMDAVKSRLLEIDREVLAELQSGGSIFVKVAERSDEYEKKPDDLVLKIKSHIQEDEIGLLLEAKYRDLHIPSELKHYVCANLRDDTVVYINSPHRSPLSLNASILNRLAVFLLRQYGGLRYRAGRIEVLSNENSVRHSLRFSHLDYPDDEIQVDEVVVRHGPVSIIDKLFPKAIAANCHGGAGDIDDPTRHRMYPDEFLSLSDLLVRKQKVKMEYAVKEAHLAMSEHFMVESIDEFGVRVHGEDRAVQYFAKPSAQTAESKASALTYHDFEVVIETKGKAVRTRGVRTGRAVSVSIGSPITSPDGKYAGTLGCFVRRLDTGAIAMLSAGSVLKGISQDTGRGAPIWRSAASGSVARVTKLAQAVPSSPRATLSAQNVTLNEIDAGIADLEQFVRVNYRLGPPKLRLPSLRAPEQTSQLRLNERVLKIGRTTGVTFGTIKQVGVIAQVAHEDGVRWFKNLFIIEAENLKDDEGPSPGSSDDIVIKTPSFSLPGDGGALIVRADDGTALGLLIASNGVQAYACPILPVLSALDCELLLDANQGKALKLEHDG
ncbi:NAD(P)/FAD-dependent oxidoreductase [Paraburkholderia bryophila]|uniref:Uncharacterized protein n=1 Tax=Paraburkholderia bryophila TaxID=420952 RepID=A0A7Z0B2D1_9BURK|nr:NAD(P)/FAD-dependent oxidoreductase [Paraburkholderia bryophila]NYH18861.1 hypothetical protein [Paraburkholderia bryophila]